MKTLTDEERLKLAERDRFVDQLAETIDNDKDNIDFKTASAIQKKLHTVAYNNLKEQGKTVARVYPTATVSNAMYEGVLKHERIDNNTTIESVVDKVVDTSVVNKTFWEQCRTEPYGKELAKSVVEKYQEYPEYKLIKKNAPIDIYKLKGAKTLNNQIVSLVRYKRASDTLENMKETIKQHEIQLKDLETRIDSKDIEVDRLLTLTGIDLMSDKEMVASLKQKGYSQERVAKVVSKSVKTIKRWWQEG